MIKKIWGYRGIDSDKQQSKYIQMQPNCYSLPMALVHLLFVMHTFVLLRSLGEKNLSMVIFTAMYFLSCGTFFKFSNKVLQILKPWILQLGYILGFVVPLMHIGCSTAFILKHSAMILKSVLVIGGAAQMVVLIIDIFLPIDKLTTGRVKSTFNELSFVGLIISGLAIVCWLSNLAINTALFTDIAQIFVGWCLTLIITMLFQRLNNISKKSSE